MKLFLSEEQISNLLNSAKRNTRDYCLFQIALSTGFRVSDLVVLTKDDVLESDRSVKKSVRIRMQKTGSYIERPLREDCRESIRLFLEQRSDNNPYLFISYSNKEKFQLKHLNRVSVHRIYKSYLMAFFQPSQLKGNSCHITRRSIAKLISDKVGRIEAATEFLGHKSIATTRSYLDVNEYREKADSALNELKW